MNITGGIYNGRRVLSPDENITRPTLSKVRMGVFNSLFSLLGDFENKTFLDVFGGSGIMGLEALSRGFKTVKVFEINNKSVEIIKKNYASLGLIPDITVGNSLNLLKNLKHDFDVIYVDPPYQSGIYTEVINSINSGIIVVECDNTEDLKKFNVIKQKQYGSCYISYIKK